MSERNDEVNPATVAALRQRLAEAEERNLNAIDAIRGAEARVAQAKRDSDELFHRLDIRETELRHLKELLGFDLGTPFDDVRAALTKRLGSLSTEEPAGSAGG